MLRKMIGTLLVLVVLGAVAYTASPQVRFHVKTTIGQLRGWGPEARKDDPVGFTRYAIGRLQRDIAQMTEVRAELLGQIAQLASKLREQRALEAQANRLAEELRRQYHQAAAGGAFPVAFRGGLYGKDRIVAQVSMLLAEAEGYRRNAEQLEQVLQKAEEQLEKLTVQVEQSKSQLAALRVKQPMLEAKELAVDGTELVAQVDQLLEGNQQVIAADPLRTVRELLAAETPIEATEPTTRERALAFLDAFPEEQPDRQAAGNPAEQPAEDSAEQPAEPIAAELAERFAEQPAEAAELGERQAVPGGEEGRLSEREESGQSDAASAEPVEVAAKPQPTADPPCARHADSNGAGSVERAAQPQQQRRESKASAGGDKRPGQQKRRHRSARSSKARVADDSFPERPAKRIFQQF